MFRPDRFFTLYLFRFLMGLRRVDGGFRIPILMYHSISDDPEPGVHSYYKICTSPVRFREQMQFLKDNGYQVIPLSAITNILNRPNRPNTRDRPKYVILTFDDGYMDFYTTAWPVLSDLGFQATVFIPTAFIDDNMRSFKGRQCLSWSQIRELHKQGVSFGSHTVNHVQLHGLKWSEIEQEIEGSRKAIEDKIGEYMKEFSCPYAYPEADQPFCEKLSEILKKYGYNLCVTTRIGRVLPGDDPLRLKRLPVNSADDLGLFSAKLSGAYDWLAHVQHISKSIKSNRQAKKTKDTITPSLRSADLYTPPKAVLEITRTHIQRKE